MKKFILLSLILVLSYSSFAQKKWHSSFFVSPWFTKSYETYSYYPDTIDVSKAYNKKGLAFIAGIDFYRNYNYNFFFKTGIHYGFAHQKGKSAFVNYNTGAVDYYNYKYNESYAFLPIMFGYKFNIKKQKLFLSAGMEFKYTFHYSGYYENYGKFSAYNNFIYNTYIKFVFSAGYTYQLNDRFTLIFNPEYVQSKTFDQLDWGDYLLEFRLKFGVVLHLNKKNKN